MKKGTHHTEESRRKLSEITKQLWSGVNYRTHMIEVHKGQKSWNKGLTVEQDSRIARPWLGKKRAPETIEKIKKAKTGKKVMFSPEHLTNLRAAIKCGKDSPHWKGRIEKICPICYKIFKVRQSKENRIYCSRQCYFEDKITKERLKKMQGMNKGKKLSKEHIKKCLRRRIPSSLEEKFQKIIDKYNLPYKYVGDGSFIIDSYNPDFINVNSKKIAIEVYARYYKRRHDLSIDRWKEERTKVFNRYGWKIIYFDETEVDDDYVLSKIK